MKHLPVATLGVLLAASAAWAQAPTPANSPAAPRPQTPAQTTQRPDPEIDDAVRVTGCLRLWDASIGALPGEPSSGPRYVLTNARQDDNPGKDVVVLRRYMVTADSSVNLAGNIDKTVRVSGSVTPLAGTLKLPAPGEITPRPGMPVRPGEAAVRPGEATTQRNEPAIRPGEAARPGEIPAPISDQPHPDPTWLALSASSIEMVGGGRAAPR